MTVSSTAVRSGPFTTNGVTTDFAFTFAYVNAAQVIVYTLNVAGAQTIRSSSLYDFVPDPSGEGGTISFIAAPSYTDPLYIESAPDFTQQVDLSSQGQYLDQVSEGLDAIAINLLALKDKQARDIAALDPAAIATAGAAQIALIDAEGAVILTEPTGTIPVARDASLAAILASSVSQQALIVAAALVQMGNIAVTPGSQQYASTADALSNGVYKLASIVNGTGGANGTWPLAFSGGGGTLAAGTFTVAGGIIDPTSIVITCRGRGYTSAPTVSFAASSGLTGASATAVLAQNAPNGAYFIVASGGNFLVYLSTGAGQTLQGTYESLVNAQTARAALQASIDLLKTYVFQRIGTANTPVVGTSTATTTNTYRLNTQVTLASTVDEFQVWAMNSGTIKLKSLDASDVLQAEVSLAVTGGQNNIFSTATSNAPGLSVPANGRVAVYSANSVVGYIAGGGAGTTAWSQKAGDYASGGGFTNGGSQTLEMTVNFKNAGTQTVTAAALTALTGTVTTNTTTLTALGNSLTVTRPGTIGRTVTPVTGSSIGASYYTWGDPFLGAGKLLTVTVFPLAAGTLSICRWQIVAGNRVFQELRTVTITSGMVTAGIANFTIADFGASSSYASDFAFGAGEYWGLFGSGLFTYVNLAADGVGWYGWANTTTGAIGALSTSQRIQAGCTYQYTQQFVTASAFAPLMNKAYGVLGDSISSVYAQRWQNVFTALTGAVLTRQDARPGRAWPAAFEAFATNAPQASLSSIGTYAGANPCSGAVSGGSTPVSTYNTFGTIPADGTTLAQYLAPLDYLLIFLGTNDAHILTTYPVGALGDAYTANTLNGNINWVLDALTSPTYGKPTLKIRAVTNYYPPGTASYANARATADAIIANCHSRGIPCLDLMAESGISTMTASTLLLGDLIHPQNTTFDTIIGPAIARFCLERP